MANNMRSIGAVISLEGESQFRRAVTSCNTSLRTMRSEMQLVSEQYRGQANSMEALQARHSALERTLERSTALQTTLQQALENAERNYQNAGTQLESYRRQLEQATSSLAELESQQSDVADDALAQQIAEQRAEMERLTDIVSRGERAYATAGDNVERWRQQLNSASADVIRLQRELDDNNQYLQEASESADHVATSIDEMGRAVRNTSNDVEESAGDSADAVEQLTENTARFFTSEIVNEYADKISEAFSNLAAAAWESAQQIDEAYDTVARKTGATGDELQQYKDIIDNIYGDMPADINEIGQAVGETSRYFKAPAEEIEKFSEKLLKFGYINETEVSDTLLGTSRIITAFGGSIKDADKLLDTLTASAQDSGLQIDEVLDNTLTNAAAFKELDLDASGAVKFMSALMESGMEAESAVSSLENAYDTCKEQGKNFAQSLLEVNDRLTDGKVTTEDMAMAQELFGDGFAKMVDVIKSGNIDFRDLVNNMNDTSDATNRVEKTFEATKDSYDDVSVSMNNLKAVSGELTKSAMDTLSPAIDAVANVLKEANKAFDDLPDGVKETVAVLGLLATGAGILAPKIIAVKVAIDTLRSTSAVTTALNSLTATLNGTATAAEATAATTAAASATTATATTGLVSSLKSAALALGPYALAIAGAGIALKGISDASDEYVASLKEQDKTIQVNIDSAVKYKDKLSEIKDEMENVLSDFDGTIAESSVKKDMAEPLVSALEELQSQSNKTSVDIKTMQEYVSELNTLYPDLGLEVDDVTGSFKANGVEVQNLSKYMSEYMNKVEDAAKMDALKELEAQKIQAEVDFEVSKNNREELEKDMEEQMKRMGLSMSFDDFNNLDPVRKFGIAINPVMRELYGEWNDLVDAQNDLNDAYNEASDKVEVLRGQLEQTNAVTATSTEETKKNTESWTGAGAQADAVAQKYVDLAVKIQQAGGDINAVSQSFTDEEGALKELFEQTSVAWQTSHDEITSGLADEVNQLAQNSNQWKQYRDDVASSIQSVSDMFSLREEDEAINWQSMQNGLVSNANAYDLWLANTEAVLQSARYANDEAFREIANTIMNAGIDSADYLDDFVQNVNLNTTTAYDDIAQFVELNGLQEKYAGVMANLKMATEEGMGGVAQVFDDTKTAAEMSMQEMSDMLQERSDLYNEYAENAKGIVESERYKTDENFRMYANTLLQQGIAGAEQVATLWSNLQSGSAQVDAAVQGYMSLQGAIDQYADVWASIQNTTQYGADGTVMIIDNAGDAWKQAAINDEMLLASGITGDKALSAVENMTQKTINALNSDSVQEEYYNAGKAAADAFAAGFEDSPLVHQYDGTGPLATLLKDNKSQKSVTNNMNLTVNQKDDGNWFSDITNWIRKQLS